MFHFFKRGAVQATEADLAKLESRRTKLVAQLEAARKALDIARQKRVVLLLDDDEATATARAQAEKICHGCERDSDALTDALAEIETRINAATRGLRAARDAELREKDAAQREKDAGAIEAVAAELDRDIAKLAATFGRLVASIPLRSVSIPRYGEIGNGAAMTPTELARAIVAEALYAHSEEMFEVYGSAAIGTVVTISMPVFHRRHDGALSQAIPKNDDSITFLPAPAAAARTIVDPLRKAAYAIRHGQVAPGAPFDPATLRPMIIEPSSFEVSPAIILTKRVRFINQVGDYQILNAWYYPGLPKPIADAALALGVALPDGTPEAYRHNAERHRDKWRMSQPGAGPQEPEKPIDLHIDLKQLYEAEKARLNGDAT